MAAIDSFVASSVCFGVFSQESGEFEINEKGSQRKQKQNDDHK